MKLLLGIITAAALAQLAHADEHSFANTEHFRTTQASLDLRVDFARRELSGHVDLAIQTVGEGARHLVLDTRDLTISSVELLGERPATLQFTLGARDPMLGAPLTIAMTRPIPAKFVVRIAYRTSPKASGLQWLTPAQTADKREPFLYSQSQAIHARSWIPLQDTPQVRVTYDARIRTPKQLLAVMSAQNDPGTERDGDYRFHMAQPIPSYLFALSVGDLVFAPIGPRTGIYAERSRLAAARHEFADVEAMLATCEKLFGPYRWSRYDLLILPPSFMLGGMENPRLSFITPTAIAGDRSLAALIAHELAHSWSGNLVSNANWESIWLNEGFTTYLERRIVEVLYGADRRSMEDLLGLQALQRDIRSFEQRGTPALTLLNVDLRGRAPGEAFSKVPYEKGRLFIGFLESRLGRERLDAFMRSYFANFAFQSVTTQTFLDYLSQQVLSGPDANVTLAEIEVWLKEPGIPALAVLPASDAFARVDAQRIGWLKGERSATQLETARWTTHEWLHFLDNLPSNVSSARLAELDAVFNLTAASNSEIAHSWLMNAIRAGYSPAWPRLEDYLSTIGRRKLVQDLYAELLKSPQGTELAKRIYAKARPLYQVPLVEHLDASIPRG